MTRVQYLAIVVYLVLVVGFASCWQQADVPTPRSAPYGDPE